jgi:hypothetical protein
LIVGEGEAVGLAVRDSEETARGFDCRGGSDESTETLKVGTVGGQGPLVAPSKESVKEAVEVRRERHRNRRSDRNESG